MHDQEALPLVRFQTQNWSEKKTSSLETKKALWNDTELYFDELIQINDTWVSYIEADLTQNQHTQEKENHYNRLIKS